jgi:hypothetical protein
MFIYLKKIKKNHQGSAKSILILVEKNLGKKIVCLLACVGLYSSRSFSNERP